MLYCCLCIFVISSEQGFCVWSLISHSLGPSVWFNISTVIDGFCITERQREQIPRTMIIGGHGRCSTGNTCQAVNVYRICQLYTVWLTCLGRRLWRGPSREKACVTSPQVLLTLIRHWLTFKLSSKMKFKNCLARLINVATAKPSLSGQIACSHSCTAKTLLERTF